MKHGRVAQRYAEALLQAAVDGKAEDAVAQDVDSLGAIIRSSRDLQLMLKSPVIKQDKKREVLTSVFAGKLHAMTLGFLDLVTEKGRENALPEILDRFTALRNERLGILNVSISAGAELSGDQQKAMKDRFAEITKKTIRMDVSVDAALRGGFLARVGDTVFDGTIKRQLELMRQKFLEGNGTN